MRIFVFVLIYYGYSIRMIQSQENRDLRIDSHQPSYDLTKQSLTKGVAVDQDWLLFFGADKGQLIPITSQNVPSEVHIQETYAKQDESSNTMQFMGISKDENQNSYLKGQLQPNVTNNVISELLNKHIVSYNSQQVDKSQNANDNKKESLRVIKEPLGYKRPDEYPQSPYSVTSNHSAQLQRPRMREVNRLERPNQHQEYSEDTDDPSIQSSQYHHLSQPQRPNFVTSSYIAPVQGKDFIPPSSQLKTSHGNQYPLNSDQQIFQALQTPMNSMNKCISTQDQSQQIFINHYSIPINGLLDHGSYFPNLANTPHRSPTPTNVENPRQEPVTQNGAFFISHKQPQFLSSGDNERSSPFQFSVPNAEFTEYKQTVDVPQKTPVIPVETPNPSRPNDQDSNLGRTTTPNSHSTGSQRRLPVNHSDRQYPSDHSDAIHVAKPSEVGKFTSFRKLTATRTSSQDELAGDMLSSEKPCEVCCKGEEVEPCKSCCNYIPLLNARTFKTVVG